MAAAARVGGNPYALPEEWRGTERPGSANARSTYDVARSVELAAKAQAKSNAQQKAKADAEDKVYLESLPPEERAAVVVDRQIQMLRRDVLPVMARTYPSVFDYQVS